MYTSLALAAALWPATVTEYCPPPAGTIIVGLALNSRGEFLYCEYFNQIDSYKFAVNYTRNNRTFARKELDYSVNPFIPAVNQLDQRTGEHRQAIIDQQNVRLTYQTNTGSKTKSTTLLTENVDVLDAGFDNFVKSNWDELIAGRSLAINFASIAHLKSLSLRITPIAAANCGQQKNRSLSQYCFSVGIDNSLLKLLLDNIKISYDERKRLMQFSGVVNLQDDMQKAQSATISYFYKEDYLTEKK